MSGDGKSGKGPDEEKAEKGKPQVREAPRMDFSTLTLSLLTSALIHLGEIPDPISGEKSFRPEEARQAISLLEILEEKTRGNLTEDEGKLLGQALTEVRFKFVQTVKGRS